MAPEHERWADSVAPYLLGALPDDELAAFEEHMAHCADCREELDALAPAVHALPTSVEPIAPPPALRARIMAEVEREASLLAAAGPEADRPPAPRRRRRWQLGMPRLAPLAAGAALLLVGVAIGIGASQLGSGEPKTVAAAVDTAVAPRAGAELEIDAHEATLVAHGLPPAPSGRVYQVWLKRPGQAPEATSALFVPRGDGTATATVPGSMEGVEQVLVTDEPMGGSEVPTRKPFLVASMS
jgi:anti-sigma-K factor RskA